MGIGLDIQDFHYQKERNLYRFEVLRSKEVEEGKSFYKDGELYKILSFNPTVIKEDGRYLIETYTGSALNLDGDTEAKEVYNC